MEPERIVIKNFLKSIGASDDILEELNTKNDDQIFNMCSGMLDAVEDGLFITEFRGGRRGSI